MHHIPFLTNYFLRAQTEKLGKVIYGLDRAALSRFMSYHWPGNVRELRNVVEHAALMCRADVVGLEHLPPSLTEGQASATSGRLWDQEREMVSKVLEQTGWNKYKAAKQLGIARSTLYGKIKKFGLEPPEGEEKSQDQGKA